MIDANATFLGISLYVYLFFGILLVPSYYFWRWVVRKLRNGKDSKLWAFLATAIVTPMLYAIGVYVWIMVVSYYPSHDFDAAKWAVDKEKRYEYTNDIINSRLLIGKTKEEVVSLLGNETHDTSNNIWYYYVGSVPAVGSTEPDYLVIEFENDKAVKVYQYTL